MHTGAAYPRPSEASRCQEAPPFCTPRSLRIFEVAMGRRISFGGSLGRDIYKMLMCCLARRVLYGRRSACVTPQSGWGGSIMRAPDGLPFRRGACCAAMTTVAPILALPALAFAVGQGSGVQQPPAASRAWRYSCLGCPGCRRSIACCGARLLGTASAPDPKNPLALP